MSVLFSLVLCISTRHKICLLMFFMNVFVVCGECVDGFVEYWRFGQMCSCFFMNVLVVCGDCVDGFVECWRFG